MAPLVLLVGGIVVAGQMCDGVTRETEVRFRLGPDHQQVVGVTVSYRLEGDEVQGARFVWPDGAPAIIPHVLDLPPGRYRVRAVVQTAGGRASSYDRAFEVPAEGVVSLDLYDRAFALAASHGGMG